MDAARRPGGRACSGRRRGRLGTALAACASLLVVSACGTRLPDEDFAAQTARANGASAAAAASSTDEKTATDGAGASALAPDAGAAAPASGSGSGATRAGAVANAASGPNRASDVGVTPTTLRIGTIVAEQGVLGDAFAPAVWGLRSWVSTINAKGGIAGRTIELFTCDDREDRARSLDCAKRLVEHDKVFALVATNSRGLGGATPYLQSVGIPVLGFPITNGFNRYSHFFSAYGSNYPRDNVQVGFGNRLQYGSAVYRYFRQRGVVRAAIFGYDIDESSQAVDLFQRGMELEGMQVTRYLVSFAAPSFDTAVADMQRKGVQLIVDAMDPGANVRLCDAMQRRGFKVMAKLTVPPAFGEATKTQLNDTCRPVTYIDGGTRPYTVTSVPFIKEFQDAMHRYQPGKPLHQWALEAWVMGDALRQALVLMGPAPTRAGFEQFLVRPVGVDVPGVLSQPLKWTPDPGAANQTTAASTCFAMAKWDDAAPGGWTNPDGFPVCIKDAHVYTTPVAETGD